MNIMQAKALKLSVIEHQCESISFESISDRPTLKSFHEFSVKSERTDMIGTSQPLNRFT